MSNNKIFLASISLVATGLLAIIPLIEESADAIICKTGQFEGFFVKSAEFCDLEIPQGIPGATGAQGPPGITIINSTNFYDQIDDPSTIPEGSNSASSFAACDVGDTAISGSYILSIGINPPIVAFFGQNDLESYATRIQGEPGNSVATTVWCFDNPPAHMP